MVRAFGCEATLPIRVPNVRRHVVSFGIISKALQGVGKLFEIEEATFGNFFVPVRFPIAHRGPERICAKEQAPLHRAWLEA